MSEETIPIIEETSSVEKRLWRFMLIALAIETVLSLILKDWQFTTGVVAGGSLAILNFRMLQTSVRGLFQTQSNFFAVKFFLRYAIIGSVILIFYYLEFVSISGTLLGISCFVIALMLEALVQVYFVIIKHEEV